MSIFGVGRWLSIPLLFVLFLSSLSIYYTNKSGRLIDGISKWKPMKWNIVPVPPPPEEEDHSVEDNSTSWWPAISDLVRVDRTDEGANTSTIIAGADVQFLLDFAIIGHSKTATSDLLHWLARHDEVQASPHEVRSLYRNNPGELVEFLYSLPAGHNFKRGYKHPLDIAFEHTLDSFREYWPKTGLIVGVRHPIKWFESWFNFRTRMSGPNFRGEGTASDPLYMRGQNMPFQMFFHRHLALLGKTQSHNNPNETKLLSVFANPIFPERPLIPNKVFLYDVSQPFDQNETRQTMFREDFQNFIGLTKPLPPLRIGRPSRNFHYALDICEDKYKSLRSDILQLSQAASTWITTFFMNHPDVTISSKEHFQDVLSTWFYDPCDSKTEIATPVLSSSTNVSTTWEQLGLPPLVDLIDNETVKEGKNVEFLLNFGIVGHAKTATTAILRWLCSHPEVQMLNEEIHDLTVGKPGLFVEKMYSLPAGHSYKRGYKAPNDIAKSMPRDLLRTYFPNANLVIGIRHPIKHFESWVNYSARKEKKFLREPLTYLNDLPYQIKTHVNLAYMGKTQLSEPAETALLSPYLQNKSFAWPRMNQPVLLYEVSQPFDRNETRNSIFRKDLSGFLGLSTTLDPMSSRNSSKNFHFIMDICEDQYIPLRRELMKLGKDASTWILDYFLELPDVHVSSKDHFTDILRTWEHDTCTVELPKQAL